MNRAFLPVGLSLVVLAFFPVTLVAEEYSQGVREVMKKFEIKEDQLRQGPLKGMYELRQGTQIYYLSHDGKYLVTGDIIDLQSSENLTESRVASLRAGAVGKVRQDSMISFRASKPKHTITVFTDIDCGYCRKLHSEIGEYNKLGITVNYLFFPRTGPNTESFSKAVSVWCNKDRNQAMTRAKAGEDIEPGTCDNPVMSHFKLGLELGVTGTPAIVTSRGDLMPGYMPPAILQQRLDLAGTGQGGS